MKQSTAKQTVEGMKSKCEEHTARGSTLIREDIEKLCCKLHDSQHPGVPLKQTLLADEPAKASTTAAAPEAASTPDDSFCQLVGANMSRDTQCLDDWRLQMLELLPAAGIQLTQVQVCKVFPCSLCCWVCVLAPFTWSCWQPGCVCCTYGLRLYVGLPEMTCTTLCNLVGESFHCQRLKFICRRVKNTRTACLRC